MTDVTPLQPGQRHTSRAVTLDRERIVAYARAFGPQPAHQDEAQAAGSAFGTLVASGWQTAALSMRLAEEALGRLECGKCTIESLKWLRPVPPGSTLRVIVEMLEPAPADGQRFRIDTLDGDGATVQTMSGILVR